MCLCIQYSRNSVVHAIWYNVITYPSSLFVCIQFCRFKIFATIKEKRYHSRWMQLKEEGKNWTHWAHVCLSFHFKAIAYARDSVVYGFQCFTGIFFFRFVCDWAILLVVASSQFAVNERHAETNTESRSHRSIKCSV